ncbi:hypothetical protein CH063_11572, partial [Colletotrichum higginsianum]
TASTRSRIDSEFGTLVQNQPQKCLVVLRRSLNKRAGLSIFRMKFRTRAQFKKSLAYADLFVLCSIIKRRPAVFVFAVETRTDCVAAT